MPWAAAAAVAGAAISSSATRSNNSANLDAAEQTRLANIRDNRIDQTNPFGTSTFGTGANGQPTQTTTLNPTQQKLQDLKDATALNNGTANFALSTAMQPILSKVPGQNPQTQWQNVIGDGATNLMTHDWLGNVGPQGKPVAAAGSPGSLLPSEAAMGMGADRNFAALNSGGGFSSGGQYTTQPTAPPVPYKDPNDISTEFDRSGVRALPGTIDDTSRKRVEEALMSRLNPQLQQDEQNLRTRLLNSGIEVGTDAYNREFNLQNQKSNDARMQAVLAGGQEEDRQTKLLQGLNDQEFAQALATGKFKQDAETSMANNRTAINVAGIHAGGASSAASIANGGAMDRLKMQLAQQSAEFNVNTGFKAADFNNQLRAAQLQEELLLRRTPIQEMTALQALSNPTIPQFQSYYQSTAQAPMQQAANPMAGAQTGLNIYNAWDKGGGG